MYTRAFVHVHGIKYALGENLFVNNRSPYIDTFTPHFGYMNITEGCPNYSLV